MCRLIFLIFLITTSNVSFSNEWNAQNFFTYFHFKSNDNYGKRLDCQADFYVNCTYYEKDIYKLRNIFKDKKYRGLTCKPNKLSMGGYRFTRGTTYRFLIDGEGFYRFSKYKYHVKIIPIITSYSSNKIRIDWGGPDNLELNRETLVIESFGARGEDLKINCKLAKPELMLDRLIEEISSQKAKNKL